MQRVKNWSKRKTTGLAILLVLITATASFAPLPMDWRRPTAKDIAKGKWKIKPLTAGGHKGIIRVRVLDLNPGEQYILRVTVTNELTGEENMIDTPPLTTEPERDA